MNLSHKHIDEISLLISRIIDPNAARPMPLLPSTLCTIYFIIDSTQTPMGNLAMFIHDYRGQLTRLMPFLAQLEENLQRESLITDPEERSKVQQLSASVGPIFHEIVYATAPIVPLY